MGETAAGAEGASATPGARRAPAGRSAQDVLAGAAYAMLVVLGVALGVTGAFHHAAYFGTDVPIAAIGWLVVLFGVLYGAGRLLRGKLGALVPGVAWMLVSMVFAGERAEGDLVIAANVAGYLYLYGGFTAAMVAVLLVPSRGSSWLLRGQGSWPRLPGDPQSGP